MVRIEPLLQDNKDRFVIFPVKHHDIWDHYQNLLNNFWKPSEIDLQQDLTHWNERLSVDEKLFVQNVLASFATSNRLLNSGTTGFLNVQYPEAQFFFGLQNSVENIHFEAYSRLLACFRNNEEEKAIFEEISELQKKIDWTRKSLKAETFAERLVTSAVVQKMCFSGLTLCSAKLEQRGLLPGLSALLQLISRDISSIANFAVHLHNNHLVNKVPKKQVNTMVLEAFEIERTFILKTFPVNSFVLNEDQVIQHLEFLADQLLVALKCEKNFNAEAPFLEKNDEKTGILEKRAGELKRSAVANKEKDADKADLKTNL